MRPSAETLAAEAHHTGFEPVLLEKVAHLLPTLNVRGRGDHISSAEYGRRLVEECREALSAVLPIAENERAFLDLLLDRGEITPSLLADDVSLQDRIRRQPLLEWKALNVQQHVAGS